MPVLLSGLLADLLVDGVVVLLDPLHFRICKKVS